MNFAILLLIAAMFTDGANSSQLRFAEKCGTNPWKDNARLFVNKGKTWREIHVKNKKSEIQLGEGEEVLAQMYAAAGRVYLMTDAPSEDFEIYQQYCFGENGQIAGMRYEIRTTWGWGYEISKDYDKLGKSTIVAKSFFDTNTEKTMKRPEDAMDEWLKPTTYLSMNNLPFIKLWGTRK